jgi:GNAT superfamily N-acetyltransferase
MIEIREIGENELEAWLGIAAAVRPDRGSSVDGYVDWKRQAEDMAWFVASLDGDDVGVGIAYVGWHSVPGSGTGEVFVLPGARGAGVGTALYRELVDWVQERGCIMLDTSVAAGDAASLKWADRHGFREIGRTTRLTLDLTAIEPPAIDPPEGVEIVTLAERPDLVESIYSVACEAYPDEPGQEGKPMDAFADWLAKDMQGAGDRPEATFIALVGDEVAGYAKLSLSRSDTTASHDMTGVRRAFRGRGIASALKRAEIGWAKAAGYESLETVNDARNDPIRHLNEKHGYVVEPGAILLRGTLGAAE